MTTNKKTTKKASGKTKPAKKTAKRVSPGKEAPAKKKPRAKDERRAYEPPTIERIDLPSLSNDVLDDAGTPLLAQQSSNVNPATLFPPPPTPPG